MTRAGLATGGALGLLTSGVGVIDRREAPVRCRSRSLERAPGRAVVVRSLRALRVPVLGTVTVAGVAVILVRVHAFGPGAAAVYTMTGPYDRFVVSAPARIGLTAGVPLWPR